MPKLKLEELLKYELAVNVAVDLLDDNEVSDILEELSAQIGECIKNYDNEE